MTTYAVPSQCPVCHDQLLVTKLQCEQCGTQISGDFHLGRLHKLPAEQLAFVETFLLCEGKINRVEQELGLSYPAVRAQLQAVVRALGREIQLEESADLAPAPPVPDERRREILDRVSSGQTTAQEAAALLRQGG